MEFINLKINSITGYTPTERAKQISAELFAISRPPVVRDNKDVSAYLFAWKSHPTSGECVLNVDINHVINIHPQNNLDKLIALMPTLPQVVKDGLVNLIKNSQTITFGQLLIGDEIVLTESQMQDDGWYDEV